MKTIYDLFAMIIFAGLVVLCLQRSTADERDGRIFQFLPPCLGCAAANYAGNHGQTILAWLVIMAVVNYVLLVLKPFNQNP